MSRYIDADEVKKRMIPLSFSIQKWLSEVELESVPTADVRENVRGEWKRDFSGNEFYWYCTHCKTEYYEEDLLMGGNILPCFCPICGCDMRKGAKE